MKKLRIVLADEDEILIKNLKDCFTDDKFEVIATTDNGPVVIEINTGAGINCVQIGCKKGLADRIFNWILWKKLLF